MTNHTVRTPLRRRLVATGARLPYRVVMRLPNRIAAPVLAHDRLERSDASDRQRWTLDGQIHVDAYWLSFRNSTGPAFSAFCGDEEIFRFDGLACRPHLHYCLAESRRREGDGRVELSERGDADLIQRACFELRHNLTFALHLHRHRAVQRHVVDPSHLSDVVDAVDRYLTELVVCHRTPQEPHS